jgi:3-oxoacyl-[acyl-carrier protein] reductase
MGRVEENGGIGGAARQPGVALVTGGGRGVGKTITKTLSEMGYVVYTCARSEAELTKTAEEIKHVRVTRVDVTDHQATHAWIEDILNREKRMDVLVNNVGVMAAVGPFVELDMDEWESVFRRNLFSMVRICQQVVPVMMRYHGGCIINLAGGGSAYPRKHFIAYACSKASVVRFSDSLAEELRPFSIRVNAIGPGLQRSAIWRHALRAGEHPPHDQWDSPEDLARLIQYLVTTSFVTGKFLHINDRYREANEAVMASDLWTLRRINPS